MKEINTIQQLLSGILNETDYKKLTSIYSSEEQWNDFLNKLLHVLLGIDTTVSNSQLFELHSLYFNDQEIENLKKQIIHEIAELNKQEYDSTVIQWLKDTNNKVFVEHIKFLKDIETGIKTIERKNLKNKLLNLSKQNNFELTDGEIQLALKIIERKRIKSKLVELGKKKNELPPNKKTLRFNYAFLILLVVVSSIVLAVSVPAIRNYIKVKFKEIFKEAKKETQQSPVKSSKQINVADTIGNKVNLPNTDVSIKDTTTLHSTNNNLPASKLHTKTIENKTETKSEIKNNMYLSIEGTWIIKQSDSADYSSSIKRISKNKFEIRYINENNLPNNIKIKRFIQLKDGNKTGTYTEYIQNEKVSSGTIRFITSTSFSCKYEYNSIIKQLLRIPLTTKVQFTFTAQKINEK